MSERAVLLDTINPAATEVLTAAGLEVVTFPKSISTSELADLVSGASILGVRTGPKIPAEVIEAGVALNAIGVFSVNTLHVDREAADLNATSIFNSKHENTRSVAELVMLFTGGLFRRVYEHSSNLHAGTWSKTDKKSRELRNATMGIIGYGSIGAQVSVLAEASGMDVVYFDSNPRNPPQGRAAQKNTIEEVLEAADVITLHVPGGMMLGAKEIARMKRGSYLINAARGNIVDYEAAAAAYRNGHLAGIAVDVYEDEPANYGDPFEHLLRELGGNVILTPHIGASTLEAQAEIGRKIAQRLLAFQVTGNTVGSINFPEMPLLSPEAGITRILNVHADTSGVLEKIVHVISSHGFNIPKTSLDRVHGTHLAYAAFDIEGAVPDNLAQEINSSVEESRRTRLVRNGADKHY